MKNLLPLASALLVLALTACGPKPEDVCDCIRQSANDFMLQGIRPSEAKLLAPCAEMMVKLKDDGAAKVRIEADYEDVKKALDAKKLLAVGGKMPEFAPLTLTYDSVLSDYARDYGAALYRYKNRAVTATVTGLLDKVDSTANGFVANCTPLYRKPDGKEVPTNTRISIPISAKLRSELAAASSAEVFDRKKHRSIEEDDRWYEVAFTGTRTYYGSMSIPNTYRSRGDEIYDLEQYLKGKTNNLFSTLDEAQSQSYYVPEKYVQMAVEVRAGNYVLLDEKKKTGNDFYFNKLTAKGELMLDGKNGYKMPLFTLNNAAILKNEDLLPGLLAR